MFKDLTGTTLQHLPESRRPRGLPWETVDNVSIKCVEHIRKLYSKGT